MEPFPWTDDPILREYKFTNVFRQLDRGTLALQELLKGLEEAEHILFNTIWYRMFNVADHVNTVGQCLTFEELRDKMKRNEAMGRQLFTGAHMTVGRAGEAKVDTVLNELATVDFVKLSDLIQTSVTLEDAFELLLFQKIYGIGKFIGYEIISDLRHNLLRGATDIMTWANIGPGCARGLLRLGLPSHLDSLRMLMRQAPSHLAPHVMSAPVPFEMREIEHSLCEFDKYQRVKTGAGRPRSRFVDPSLR